MNTTKKLILMLGAVIFVACTQLTDDQRKRLKDGMKRNEIKKITDAQVTDAAFAYGRAMINKVGMSNFLNVQKRDSLAMHYSVKIVMLNESNSKMNGIEKQLVEAYATGAGTGQLNDNVQEIGKDSILYTKPFLKELPDGSNQFNYAIGIKASRKQIVLSM